MTCPSKSPLPTIAQLLEKGAAYLLRHGLDEHEAATQAGILLSEVLHLSPLHLSLKGAETPSQEAVDTLRRMFQRVGAGEPIQYVIGHWPFHTIELKTDPRALIPRPETEELVEYILKSEHWKSARHIVDVGVGTGAIILALAHAARSTTQRPEALSGATKTHAAFDYSVAQSKVFTGIDLSADALSLARENAQALDLPVNFIHGSSCAMIPPASVDILVSNPPYIATAEVDTLAERIRCHEPRMALDGGADGLDILHTILLDALMVLRPEGRLYLEIGDEQGLAMHCLLERAGYTDVRILKDLSGHDRFALATLR